MQHLRQDTTPFAVVEAQAAMLAGIRQRIEVLALDLRGLRVVTEAATGAYACTPAIAAMAGAERVSVFARDTRHGTAQEAFDATLALAAAGGVLERITVLDRVTPGVLADCDILTNSGHLRPIGADMVRALPPRAVIALMFEAWEFRGSDLDLPACRRRGIRVAAVNECHPAVAVFPFLGPLCVKLLAEAGVRLAGARILVWCDNPFAPFIAAGLESAGAEVGTAEAPDESPAGPWDAVVLALDPNHNPPLAAEVLPGLAPGTPIAQFWGDIDRPGLRASGLRIVPDIEPRPGHMGILLNALGPQPILRLQAGGLKAAALVRLGEPLAPGGIAELL